MAEFVATHARDDIAGSQVCLNAPADDNERVVPRPVAQAVVDHLEPVEVKKKHCETVLGVLLDRYDGTRQLLAKIAAIGKIGQTVVIGDVMQSRFRESPCGDVLHLDDQTLGIGIASAEECAVEQDQQRALVV